jgi:hypothetical protein
MESLTMHKSILRFSVFPIGDANLIETEYTVIFAPALFPSCGREKGLEE